MSATHRTAVSGNALRDAVPTTPPEGVSASCPCGWHFEHPSTEVVSAAAEWHAGEIMPYGGRGGTGVWAAYGYEVGPFIISVHETELEAWRAANPRYGSVVFLPWGREIAELVGGGT